jgi:hypothetical protein
MELAAGRRERAIAPWHVHVHTNATRRCDAGGSCYLGTLDNANPTGKVSELGGQTAPGSP